MLSRALRLALLGAAATLCAGGPALGESVPVRVDRDICARVVEHVPEDDVAYKSGVGAGGKPVAPADLPGSFQLSAPEGFVVILDVDLSRPPRPVPEARRLEATVPLGLLTVRNGRVYYDGQPLGDPDQARLAGACREYLRRRR